MRLFVDPPTAVENIDHDPYVDLHQLRPLFELDDSTGRWEIPPSRYNFFRPESFPVEKSAQTRRVFVLGGSTVQGRPYSTETAFSTWLKFRLQAAGPQWNYEVINCGGVSYASYRVAKILQEVLRHQPDAIVLYTGHNEFLEDRTYADVRSDSLPTRLINMLAAQLRTVGWIKRQFFADRQRPAIAAEVDARLDHSDGLESYQRDPIWNTAVEQHFQSKLSDMIDAVRDAGVPLVLCTPASDIVDTPPIKSQLKSGLSKDQQARFEKAFKTASDNTAGVPDRIAAAKVCLAIDDQHCGSHYIVGRLLYQSGKSAAARPHLIAARDFDVCPLRATSAIVNATHLVGKQNGVMLVDTETLLDRSGPSGQRVPDQIPDPERFADHLHPTIASHQIIAAQIASLLSANVWPPSEKNADLVYQKLAHQHLQSLDEAYYARGKQRLEGLHRWATGRAGHLGTQNKTP
ncbi:GDSL-like Lipase/Acylhydrolase [Planctomycetes bacterium K23_9]|uniref:GDSL-like Lipase/Acylhydrolase n=1 Tax=Stieleria marina TaxID=1930275 RepID=A0A517NQ28_9BACT|nr:GDSL-like Lipase/Acylhydrolase [Planctomycetes bacterium K23_9]